MKKRIYLFSLLAALMGIGLAVFLIHCFYNYVTIAGPYTQDLILLPLVESSGAVTAFVVTCILCVLLIMIVPSFVLSKCNLHGSSDNSIILIFASSLLGFLFAGYAVNFIITPFRKYWSNVQLPGVNLDSADNLLKIIFYLGIIVSIPCAVYFLILATKNRFTPGNKLCILSVCPVIWFALRLVYYFMSTSAQVNIAGRKLCIISICLALVFLLQDCKRWIVYRNGEFSSKEAVKYSKLYFASGFGAVVTLLAYHVSITFLQAFWILEPSDSYFLNAIYISMALFILFRMMSVSLDCSKE